MPLLISHGWPGSVFEFHKIIPLLTEHFTSIAPSLPGYTLSIPAGQPRFTSSEIAELFAELMTRSATTLRRAGRRLGQLHHLGARPSLPAALTGIHSICCRCGAIPRCCEPE
jgi:pimeloyl-ACP methyl ester carboxylesterase